jgi:hypothetical protein
MLRVNWQQFSASIRAQAVVDAARYNEIEKRLGVSHARLINAAQGKPVGTEIFLTLCNWMQQDPMGFCTETDHDQS